MKLRVALILAAVSLLALVPVAMATTTTSSSSATSGYVVYDVHAAQNGTSLSAVVNYSVSASSTTKSLVSLAVQGTESNFTYSRLVNSSLPLLPYLPAIANDSYSYSGHNYTVTFAIDQTGTSSVSFGGSSYALATFDYSASVTSTNGTTNITGTIAEFPSDLVYSVTANVQGSGSTGTISATLTSTSLALSDPAASPAAQVTTAGLGLGLAAGAVALSLGVKFRHKPTEAGPRPDHWVD